MCDTLYSDYKKILINNPIKFLFYVFLLKNAAIYSYIPCMSSDDGDNTATNQISVTSKHSPMAVTCSDESAGGEIGQLALVVDENDEEEIHFNTNINHTHRIYCMRFQPEPDETDDVKNKNTYNTTVSSESPKFSFRSFWASNGDNNGEIKSPFSRNNNNNNDNNNKNKNNNNKREKRKQHRFLEVTDPKLEHIVSLSHVKAITSEDDIITQTLKNEAYRVANDYIYKHGHNHGHCYSYHKNGNNNNNNNNNNNDNSNYEGNNKDKSNYNNSNNNNNNNDNNNDNNKMFYEDNGTSATTLHSPINPIFYRPDRTEKISLGTGTGNSRKIENSGNSVNSVNSVNSESLLFSTGAHTVNDNGNKNKVDSFSKNISYGEDVNPEKKKNEVVESNCQKNEMNCSVINDSWCYRSS